MNKSKMAGALNAISVGFGELAEAILEGEAPQATAPVSAPPAGIREASPFDGPAEYEPLPFTADQVESSALGRCPAHDRPWTVKEAGVSKMGKSYNAFFKCDAKDGDVFCNRKPVKAWADAHAAQLA